QLNPVCVNPLIAAGTGTLERQRQAPIALDWHPAHLHVAEEDHSGWSPVLEGVRKDIRIHERAPRLAGAEFPELAVRMPETKRRLTCVHSGAEQLELEGGLELAEGGRRR